MITIPNYNRTQSTKLSAIFFIYGTSTKYDLGNIQPTRNKSYQPLIGIENITVALAQALTFIKVSIGLLEFATRSLSNLSP